MDNVSVAEGGSRHRKGGGVCVWCKYSVSNSRLRSISGRIQEMLTGLTPGQASGPLFDKRHLTERLFARMLSSM